MILGYLSPVKKGVSENQAVEKITSVTFFAMLTDGFSNKISKQIITPNVTPKSVENVTNSFPGVILSSSKGFIFRYLKMCFVKFLFNTKLWKF